MEDTAATDLGFRVLPVRDHQYPLLEDAKLLLPASEQFPGDFQLRGVAQAHKLQDQSHQHRYVLTFRGCFNSLDRTLFPDRRRHLAEHLQHPVYIADDSRHTGSSSGAADFGPPIKSHIGSRLSVPAREKEYALLGGFVLDSLLGQNCGHGSLNDASLYCCGAWRILDGLA